MVNTNFKKLRSLNITDSNWNGFLEQGQLEPNTKLNKYSTKVFLSMNDSLQFMMVERLVTKIIQVISFSKISINELNLGRLFQNKQPKWKQTEKNKL